MGTVGNLTHVPEPADVVGEPQGAAPVVPPGERPPGGGPHFALMDSMRAIAALCVVASHVGLLVAGPGVYVNPLGSLGLDLFFLISGFLLYRPFVTARVRGGSPPSFRGFYRRRALRIVPGYWFALLVLATWPGLVGVFSDDWWVYFGFLQAYSHDWIARGISPAWSLGVELSFYALLPVFAHAVHRLRGMNRSLGLDAGLVVLLGVLSVTSDWSLRQFTSLDDTTLGLISWTLIGNGMFFAAGMLLALVSVSIREGQRARWSVTWIEGHPGVSWAGAALMFGAANWMLGAGYYHGVFDVYRLLLLATAAGLLLPAVFAGGPRTGMPRRLLATSALTWLGVVSYGIYIWHRPILDHVYAQWFTGADVSPRTTVAVAVIVVPLTIGCAAVSYYVVERPALRLKDRLDERRGTVRGP